MKASDKLRAYWSKKENDLIAYHPLGFETQTDANFLLSTFNKEFIESLERRGYDITTLKFSVEPQKNNIRFNAQRPEGMTSEEAWTILLENAKNE